MCKWQAFLFLPMFAIKSISGSHVDDTELHNITVIEFKVTPVGSGGGHQKHKFYQW
jgi:hypothetical protein